MFGLPITILKINHQCKHIVSSFRHPKVETNYCKITFANVLKQEEHIIDLSSPLILAICLVKLPFKREV
jgi:hypothetical protein